MILIFFNDTATTEIYTLSLHDALPISRGGVGPGRQRRDRRRRRAFGGRAGGARRRRRRTADARLRDGRRDRKSTRLNSSHANISYAVFCLKKKNTSSLFTFTFFTFFIT